jgi:hypothetical protein
MCAAEVASRQLQATFHEFTTRLKDEIEVDLRVEVPFSIGLMGQCPCFLRIATDCRQLSLQINFICIRCVVRLTRGFAMLLSRMMFHT